MRPRRTPHRASTNPEGPEPHPAHARAFSFLACGAGPQGRSHDSEGYGIGGLTAYGTLLGDYTYDWLQRDLVSEYYYTANERLPQYATEAVLRRRASQLPAIDVRYGWTAERVDQDSTGVTVVIRERSGSREDVVRADYLVGCDGSRSRVREQAGITQTLAAHDRRMVLLVFRSADLHRLLAARFPGKS